MTTYAWDPFRDIDAMLAGLDRLLDRPWSTAGMSPGINVYANDEAAVVTTELPGVRGDQVQVQLLDDVLTISAERAGEAETAKGEVLVNERPSLRFSRSVTLPFAVDANQVEARLKDGILTVALRRAEADKPRKIAVATA